MFDAYTSPERRIDCRMACSTPNPANISSQEEETDTLLKSFDLEPEDYLSTPLRQRFFPRLDIEILRRLIQPSPLRLETEEPHDRDCSKEGKELEGETRWKCLNLCLKDSAECVELPMTPPHTVVIPQISRFPTPEYDNSANPFFAPPSYAMEGTALYNFRGVIAELMEYHAQARETRAFSPHTLPSPIPRENKPLELHLARDRLRVLPPSMIPRKISYTTMSPGTALESGGVKKFVGAINASHDTPFSTNLNALDVGFIKLLIQRAEEELAQADELRTLALRLETLARSRIRIVEAVGSGKVGRG